MRLYDPLSVIYTGDCAVYIKAINDNVDLKNTEKFIMKLYCRAFCLMFVYGSLSAIQENNCF